MESSVKSISRPVIDRLPVTSLDEFACRQLDRVRATCLLSVFCSSLSLLFLFVIFAPTPLRVIRVRVLIFSRFSSGATVLVRDDHQALTRMSAARAVNVNENGDAAVATRVHKYVT